MLKRFKFALASIIFVGITAISSQEMFAASGAVPKNLPPGFPIELFDNTSLTPTKVFDNLYCIGTKSVVAWALKTSDGIILIDAMWDDNDGKSIMNGMKQLGLDPQEIKYILITHGHGDHYGGAQYIKDHTNAKVIMSKVDFEYMTAVSDGANGPRSTKPKVDEFVKDGDKVILGDTAVTVVETPGHTPGGLSFIYPVKQDGKTYMSAIWGGTGLPRELDEKIAYRNSIDHFAKYTSAANVTIETTAHLFAENGYAKLENSRTRKTGEMNPFYVGEKGFASYLDSLRSTLDKAIKDQKSKS